MAQDTRVHAVATDGINALLTSSPFIGIEDRRAVGAEPEDRARRGHRYLLDDTADNIDAIERPRCPILGPNEVQEAIAVEGQPGIVQRRKKHTPRTSLSINFYNSAMRRGNEHVAAVGHPNS